MQEVTEKVLETMPNECSKQIQKWNYSHLYQVCKLVRDQDCPMTVWQSFGDRSTRRVPGKRVILDPVERLYSFINHCVHNQWQFCQKWNFKIEPIIGYTTTFFQKYNSTSWYHGLRSANTGYPNVWYDDFINVSPSIPYLSVASRDSHDHILENL